MTFLNPAILYGFLLAAVPVVLHLLMKQKPRKMPFPALRLIQQRRKQNLRRMRLRHWWLMLLRVLAITALVAALTRPSLPAADYSFSVFEWSVFLGVVACGVAVYFFLLHRWRTRGLPRHEWNLKRAQARGWTTGATLLGLLLLVGCPYQQRIAGEIKAPPAAAELDLPVAAIMLFDTSLSMDYQQAGQTRLDVARTLAAEHLAELPAGSRVAIVDTSQDNLVLFQQTTGAAQARLGALQTTPVNLPLNDRIRACLLAHEDDRQRTLEEQGNVPEDVRRDRFLRRIYVFTDLSRSAWRTGSSKTLQREIERLKTVNVFVVDVGEEDPINRGVTDLELSREVIPRGGSLSVSALMTTTGPDSGEVTLELNDLSRDPLQRLHSRTVSPAGAAGTWVPFPLLSELTRPIVVGEVRLVASDPLAFDDVRSFAVNVRAPARVLVTAPSASVADRWMTLLNPGLEKFRVTFVPLTRLRDANLGKFDVAYFLNVPSLPDSEWQRIAEFVEGGGGAGFVLGSDEIQPRSYNRAQAQALLPASLVAPSFRPNRRINVENRTHSLFRKLDRDQGLPIFENDFYINRFYKTEASAGASVLARFTDEDQSPAITERAYGRGRVVMFHTAVDPARGVLSRWNNFASITDGVVWPYIAFAESMTLYLARASENRYNYDAGEEVVLRLDPVGFPRTFRLKRPRFKVSNLTLPADQEELVIRDAVDLGYYELAASDDPGTPLAGFCINPRAEESDLSRLSSEELDALLGEDQYQVARGIEELEATINTTDLGREVFPIVLVIALAAFLGEHLVANRFYDVDSDTIPEGIGQPGTAAG